MTAYKVGVFEVFKGKAPTRHIPLSAFQERVMNLLVTSTLTISSDPYTIQNAITEAGTETETETKGSPVESNGVEPITSAGDADEVMAEVEEAEVEDVMTVDMDTIEAIVRSSEAADTTPTSDS
uniref:Uncharacterized protein n=1 Tax=Solanum tuberosum TaxID=4113 RepID=M1AGG7_SOLTU